MHVALATESQVRAAAIALPARSLVLSTADADTRPDPLRDRPIIVVSRTRPRAEAEILRQAVNGELFEMGSAGAKTAALLTGFADVYVHSGGQYGWDLAAPAEIARAAGLHVSRLDGSPLRFNRRRPWLPDVLICRRHLARPILDALAADRASASRTASVAFSDR